MMRRVYATFLTAGLIVLAASPAFAQRPPGPGPGGFPAGPGMAPVSAVMLLRNEKVAEELKLTDDQKADVKKASDAVAEKYKADFDKARAAQDREKMGELFKAQNEDTEKAVVAALKSDQAKRLKQIEVQAAGLGAFSREDVQAALNLTDKQKQEVKEANKDLQDDIQEIFKGAQGDREKMPDAFKKVQTLRTETQDKLVNGLTAEQKKTWKDLTGDKFEVVLAPGGFGPGGPGGFGPGGPGGPPQPGQVMSAGLQEVLKITADQKKQLEDLQKEVDAKLEKILTDEQKKQIKDMRAGPGPGGPRPGPGRDRPNPDR
jgi:Spy/CpxP family protein refolding chaperone